MALTDFKITNYADSIAELPDTPSSSGISATQLKALFDGRTNKEVKESINGIIEILSSVNGASNVSATPVKVDGADTVQGILDELEQNKIDKTAEADYMRISAYDTDKDGVVDNAMALAGQPIEYFETKEEADNRNDEVTRHLEETDLNHTNLKTDYEAFKEATTTDLANRVEKEEGKGLSKNDLTDELKGGYDDAVALKHWHDNKPALDSIPSGGVVNTLGADDTTIPTSKAVADAISFAGGGDMLKSTYDSNNNGIVDNAEALEGNTLTQVVEMAVESAKQNVSASDVGAYTISQTDEVVGNTLASAKAYADGVESNAKTYADTKTNTVLRDAKNYVDEKVGSVPIVEDTSYLASYMAFCTNANTDSLDAAFGKNNEEDMQRIGRALAMYAWFKGDSKEEYPFNNLIDCDTWNDILNNPNAKSEVESNMNLINLMYTSPYALELYRNFMSDTYIFGGDSNIQWKNSDTGEIVNSLSIEATGTAKTIKFETVEENITSLGYKEIQFKQKTFNGTARQATAIEFSTDGENWLPYKYDSTRSESYITLKPAYLKIASKIYVRLSVSTIKGYTWDTSTIQFVK